MRGGNVALNTETMTQHRPGGHVTEPACGTAGDFALAQLRDDRRLCQHQACFGGE